MGSKIQYMKQNNFNPTSHSIISVERLFKTFSHRGNVYCDTSVPYDLFLKLAQYCPDGINMMIINENQQNNLFSNSFNRNGTTSRVIDGLENVCIQKYVNKFNNSNTETTNLESYVSLKSNYSNYIKNLIIEILTIMDIPFEKLSEIIQVFTGVYVPPERICEIYQEGIKWKIFNDLEELQNEVRKGNIELSGIIHYDEQFLWVKHQRYVRLTIIDAKCRLILQDIVVPRQEFNKYFVKNFLKESIEGFDIHTIVTDGHRSYPEIIDELGLIQHRCTFHIMKNLMDKLTPIHNVLRNKIKSLEKEIPKLEAKLEELKLEYKGVKGRPKNDDLKRKKNIEDKNKLNDKISAKKKELRQMKKELKEDEKIIAKLSRLWKYKTISTCKNKFYTLYNNRDQFRKEIKEFLEKLEKYLDKALNHVFDSDIPTTNNTIEAFFKITLPRCSKRKFMTYEGMMNRILLNDIRYMKRNVRIIS